MKGNDAVLALLQDIKDILYGIALLIMGGVLCVAGILLANIGATAGIAGIIGLCICIYGIARAHEGHRHHEVVENPEDTPNH